ncbi:mitochondrial amidoxime reducing component 2 [Tetranychus urticae]|uniref:MOSC domain-containing protein n=1 Tax=Tetranychus urticae TaxID=32264 RepID=T1KRX1_TETUR|nr:mitochondrial amidoxime reducing component 2 [Tetranychus urticae]
MEANSSTIKLITTSVTIGFIGASIAYILWKVRNRNKIKPFIDVGKVKKIFIYPIKSLKPIECDQVDVDDQVVSKGQLKDRSFVLIDENNKFITQRQEPTLVLLDVELIDDRAIKITSPSKESIEILLSLDLNEKTELEIIQTRVWEDDVNGIDCGTEASQFFSNYLNKPNIRLLRFVKGLIDHRPSQVYRNGAISKDSNIKIMYQDSAPVLIINDKSIDTLNDLLTDGQVSHSNFRPNILIEAEAFDEDNWERLVIGETQWQQLKKCTRCRMTTVNVETGVFMKEPMITLRKYRKPTGPDSGYHSPLMGVFFKPETRGIIKVGDSIAASHKS